MMHTKIQSITCIWEATWDSWVRGESGGARRWKSIRESQSLWGALEPPLAASWDYHPGKPHKRPALFSVSCTWALLELLLHLESIMEQHMGPSRTAVSLACGTAERHRKRKTGEKPSTTPLPSLFSPAPADWLFNRLWRLHIHNLASPLQSISMRKFSPVWRTSFKGELNYNEEQWAITLYFLERMFDKMLSKQMKSNAKKKTTPKLQFILPQITLSEQQRS